MTIDDLLSMVETFATTEAPSYIQDGKRIGVRAMLPLAKELRTLVGKAITLPMHPFNILRVQSAFKELGVGLKVVEDSACKLMLDQ
jgi:hypothetical protein